MMESAAQIRGLIVRDPWYSLILCGEKTWEMRSQIIRFRGLVALIRKGSGSVGGLMEIIDCLPGQNEAEYGASQAYHCVPTAAHKQFAAKWPVAWVIAKARPLAWPVPYRHKKGAQSRVLLSVEESAAVKSADPFGQGAEVNS